MTIAITGNPGVGKHATSIIIANKLNIPLIDINMVAKNAKLFEKDEDTNNVDTVLLKNILERQISKKSIIVGHLAPYILDKDQIDMMIVLRRNPYDLITTYRHRGYLDKKCNDNTGSEILGVIANDAMLKFQEKSFQIDTSGKKIIDVANRVLRLISNDNDNDNDNDNNDIFNDSVDWLGLITRNNDLKKFFPDN